MKEWLVYMLYCSDGSIYTGITSDIERRLSEHNEGKRQAAAYTRGRRPVRLAYRENVNSRSSALKREAEIRRLSRSEKLALIENQENSG